MIKIVYRLTFQQVLKDITGINKGIKIIYLIQTEYR